MKSKSFLLTAVLALIIIGLAAYPASVGKMHEEFVYRKSGELTTVDQTMKPEAVPMTTTVSGDVTLYGYMIYASTLSYSDMGFYSFTESGDATGLNPTEETIQAGCYDSSASVYVTVAPKPGSSTASVISLVNPSTWQITKSYDAPRYCLAHDMTYNPADGKIYGCFLSEDTYSLRFGTLDYANGTVTTIKENIQKYACVAANSIGEIYAINMEGVLLKINKETGNETVVGSTGYEPYYEQTMTFDLSTDRLFWFATNRQSSGLIELDVNTGQSTLLADWSQSMYEVVGAATLGSICPQDAPAAVTDLNVNFAPGSTTGTVSFVIPTHTFGGNALSGTLSYAVTVDGTELRTGNAVAGEKIVINDLLLTEGIHRVEVCAANDAGRGPKAGVSIVVGYDTPSTPRDVVMTVGRDNDVTLSWSPVNTGVNDGFVGEMRYSVFRLPDNKVVAENLTATTFKENLSDAPYAYYHYEVYAESQGKKSAAGVSTSKLLGYAVPLPYVSDFGNNDCNATYVVDNANDDSSKWTPRPVYKYWYYMGNTNNAADDWLFTPMFYFEAGKYYELTFDAQSTPSHNTEQLEVFCGNDTTKEAMTTRVTEVISYSNNERKIESAYIYAPTSGRYCIGFHCVSDKKQYTLLLHEVKLTEGLDGRAPAEAVVKVEPGDKGAISAAIVVTPPTKDLNGNTLTEYGKCTIVNNTTARTVYSGEVNSDATFRAEDSSPENGFNDYTILFANSYGAGRPAIVKQYIGMDVPAMVTGLTLEQDGLAAVLKWNTPGIVGKNGGYVNPDEVFYRIVLQRPEIKLVEEKATGYTYVDKQWEDLLQNSQQQVAYAVFAENSIGRGDGAVTDYKLFGTAYEVPFAESFPSKRITTTPWVNHSVESGSTCEWNLATSDDKMIVAPQDNDGGFAIFKPGNGGEQILYSPMIDLSTTVAPALKFYYWMPGNIFTVHISVDCGLTWTKVAEVDNTGDEWTLKTIDLSAYKGQKVSVGFQVKVDPANATQGAVDNIQIIEQQPTDMMVQQAYVLNPVLSGSNTDINVRVVNNGSENVSKYAICIKDGERILATESVDELLEPDEIRDILVTTPILPTLDNSILLEVEVVTDNDNNEGNNSVVLNLDVASTQYPSPRNLAAESGKDAVNLTWDAPVSEGEKQVIETFETMTPWQLGGINVAIGRTQGFLGNYLLYDGDGDNTNYLLYYPHPLAGLPMAGTVYSSIRPNDITGTIYIPHEGTQCFSFWSAMDLESNDWLIMPELGSNKKVSFWAKAVSRSNVESIRIMYSTKTRNVEDFVALSDGVDEINGGNPEDAEHGYSLFEYELPKDAKYFAINYVSYGTGLLIDELSYYPADGDYKNLRPDGYIVWRDGNIVARTDAATRSYSDTVPGDGTHEWCVSAVYGTSQSQLTDPVYASLGVMDVLNTSMTVQTGSQSIIVKGASAPVMVVNMAGVTLYNIEPSEAIRVSVLPGVYVVKSGSYTEKVIVR